MSGWEVFGWILIASACLMVLGGAASIVVVLLRSAWFTSGRR